MAECTFGRLKIHVEIPIFIIFFAFLVSDSIRNNLIIFRTCYVTLGYSKSECALLGSQHPDNQTALLEKLVQPHSSIVSMMCNLTENLTTSIFCLFAGPWSDRFGRKVLIVAPAIGYLLFYLSTTVFSLIDNLSPWYLLFSYIPVALTGGFPCYFTALLCYITDSSSESDRGIRMSFFDASLFLGIFFGTISSSYIFEATSYVFVFLLSSFCCLVNLLFVIFFMPESLTNRETEGHIKAFFDTSNIIEMVKITFKNRRNYARCTVLCCLIMTILSILVMNGNDAVLFLYLREKFHFSLKQYTQFMATYSLVYVLGTVLGVYVLHKLLKIPETILIFVSVISSLNGALVMGLAETEEVVYSVSLFRSLGGVFGPMLRSLISKVVPNEEVGKIFALVTSGQFLFGTAGSPLYTFVYNKTIATNAGAFNFLSAGIYGVLILVAVGLIIVRTVLSMNNNNYNTLINDERQSSQESNA